ncbi:Rieske Fe-S protein [Saccharopolyspora lacisalsi]|uniref:Cytochrome bc1 complex Rieske iron-sulfur subunit n=1 Tax=Halosaccharopolyspora lacisalsi TaxID=1000566 RepID=A0A839DVZ6_9PSEU|nr:Rieske (2Fe-2S) protein [Halosaccharopolyspora lacisalsi]MBA8825203.1 Rieske Fe-S protein [Halosaccharopolyspora lacisalsi]
MNQDQPTSRRRLLATGGAGAGALALSACTGGDYQGTELTSTPSPEDTAQDQPKATLIELAAVPVGGTVVTKGPDGKPVAVTRSGESEVTAHSAVCTHMGCTVKAAGDQLRCPCHGSVFEASNGDVVTGPAKTPLGAVPVHVEDGKVVTG